RDLGARARGAHRDRRADGAGAGRRAVRPGAGGAGEPRRGGLPRGWLDLLDGRARPALVGPGRLGRDPADPDEESAALAPLWRDRWPRTGDEVDDALLRLWLRRRTAAHAEPGLPAQPLALARRRHRAGVSAPVSALERGERLADAGLLGELRRQAGRRV